MEILFLELEFFLSSNCQYHKKNPNPLSPVFDWYQFMNVAFLTLSTPAGETESEKRSNISQIKEKRLLMQVSTCLGFTWIKTIHLYLCSVLLYIVKIKDKFGAGFCLDSLHSPQVARNFRFRYRSTFWLWCVTDNLAIALKKISNSN